MSPEIHLALEPGNGKPQEHQSIMVVNYIQMLLNAKMYLCRLLRGS